MGLIKRSGILFNKSARLFGRLEDILLVLIVVMMILLAGYQIILRNFFDSGISWSDPLLRIAVLWVGLLGAMAATRDNNHIKIDLITKGVPEMGRRVIESISHLFSAAVCGIIAYHAARFVEMEYQDGMTAFADVPAWACEIIMPIGFGIMALRFFFNFISRAVGFKEEQPA